MSNPQVLRLFEQLKSAPSIPDPAILLELFDACSPVSPAEMVSRWRGGGFNTHEGMAAKNYYQSIGWYGKWVTSTDRGGSLPMIMWDSHHNLYSNDSSGHGTTTSANYRGVDSAAMVYDQVASTDYFRKVDDAATIIMAISAEGDGNGIAFYLDRLAQWPAPFNPNEH